ncbi:6-phosphogluconolactonase [Actinacidiphila acidipaludis]|uniref:6-phosphogluconolactonase n=1 Tax=Actinacidiphila acidipaludis TaxID=2873382 RepID=A0ABS7QAZ2_9ACTN|nr:6-phosphogluconolactonase [Streptomyces acidipaludis]MBY8880298.1 6-phosphogluconolactonase [Streptomyces acidipaludis]
MPSSTSASPVRVHPDAPQVRVLPDAASLGAAAAAAVAGALRESLDRQPTVRVAFAAAPSQQPTLAALAAEPGIDWRRVTAFHLDEYLGLGPEAPERFGAWLRRTFFDLVPLGAVHLIETGPDAEEAARRYAALLAQAPLDLVCLGIGVNGHLAFNDPPVADLSDPADVKTVELDEVCRRQQVDDGSFATLAEVPRRAVTLTVPRLLAAGRLFCMVPGAHKRDAVRRALLDPVGAACPATALRTHQDCTLFLDSAAASALPPEVTRGG